MFSPVVPLRAIVFQCLFLLMAIAIEAIVLQRMLRTSNQERISPKQSVQYSASINLLSTVLGWLVILSFFNIESGLPMSWTSRVEVELLNFIFFDQFSNASASSLIMVGFFTFFASFTVKQLGLIGLKWLLETDFSATSAEPESELESPAQITGIRDLKKEPRTNQPQVNAVLIANAWSYSAIFIVLLIRLIT